MIRAIVEFWPKSAHVRFITTPVTDRPTETKRCRIGDDENDHSFAVWQDGENETDALMGVRRLVAGSDGDEAVIDRAIEIAKTGSLKFVVDYAGLSTSVQAAHRDLINRLSARL